VVNISGTLVTAQGAPVPGYPMRASSNGGNVQVATGTDGSFTFSGVVAGSVVVDAGGGQSAAAPALVPAFQDVSTTISVSSSVAGIVFTLPQTITITVDVSDAYGSPASGMQVWDEQAAGDQNWSCSGNPIPGGTNTNCIAAWRQSGTTDANGQASLLLNYGPSQSGTFWARDPSDQPRTGSSSTVFLNGNQSVSIALPSYPLNPIDVAAAPLQHSATVGWSPPAFDGGSRITSYVITETPPAGSRGLELLARSITVKVGPTVLSVKFSGLENGSKYRILVAAVNAVGHSKGVSLSVVPGQKATTSTTLESSSDPVAKGRPVIFTATVRAGNFTVMGGNVTFRTGSRAIGGCSSVAVTKAGVASCRVRFSDRGTENLTAMYTGTKSYRSSTSRVIREVVN
jgi:hypothetical protein